MIEIVDRPGSLRGDRTTACSTEQDAATVRIQAVEDALSANALDRARFRLTPSVGSCSDGASPADARLVMWRSRGFDRGREAAVGSTRRLKVNSRGRARPF